MQTLAVKYRPENWDSVVEQGEIKVILKNQLTTNTIKNAYLFVGGAGTGKTTCARIFANEINKGKGNPIEMDAASNSSVNDVRDIIQQAKKVSLNSDYKVFIIDECHALSDTAWQAFLKLIEEPPAKSIFIFCTTDPQKIPKTILSRVQRYDFKRISQDGIVQRLEWIIQHELVERYQPDALEYIAKMADGGMRDAITMMDKCLSFGELILENVVKALGVVDYKIMMQLTDGVICKNCKDVIQTIEGIHSQGKDIKQFVNQYTQFLLDVQKYDILGNFDYLQLPALSDVKNWLDCNCEDNKDMQVCTTLLDRMVKLNSSIKWSQTPKYDLETVLLLICVEE